MEQISIKSFLANGHSFHLYVYEDVRDIPDGTVIKDANEILPEKDIFTCSNGSYAGFADVFRYKLLWDKGGYWSDLDIVCLRPFDFKAEYLLASEYSNDRTWKICNGIIKVPRGCEFIRACYEKGQNINKDNIGFGEVGYVIFIPLVTQFKLERFIYPPEMFCPLDWWDYEKLIDSSYFFEIPREAYAIHLWNEMWRRGKLDKDVIYPPESLYGKLQHRFLNIVKKLK